MRSYLGSALFSASDLVNFTGCRHCTFLDLRDLLNGEDFKGAVTALTAIALSSLLEMKTLHRDDSPAIEYADGSKEWWIDGHELKAAAITALQRKLQLEEQRRPSAAAIQELLRQKALLRPTRLKK
jgi:hypothetical protein